MQFDVVIVGAGAAGLFCAMEAGKRGRRVLLLDKSSKPAEKIRISGGGRCNFTNIHTSPANYLSQNPHFCKSALGRYTPQDFIALVEKHGIAYHEKTLGQLFCDGSAKQIIQMLLDECAAAGVELALERSVSEIARQEHGYTLSLSRGEAVTCQSLVIATGGASIPKMGATGWGYEVARQFGLKVIPPRPALVPFTLEEAALQHVKPLAGISLDSVAHYGDVSFREGMLFTHRGLSGPSILQISSYWHEGQPVTLNLLPEIDVFSALRQSREEHPKQAIHNTLMQWLPKRLVQIFAEEHGLSGSLAEMSNKRFKEIAALINQWNITPKGTEGYRTAEVTIGGVDTAAISSRSFEAKKVEGLYFIGEVLDVTGHLGGYNFQWAWASGYCAGQCV